jgi:hypothetical protein
MEQGEALGGRQGEDSCRTPRTRRPLVFSLKFFWLSVLVARRVVRRRLRPKGCAACAPKANIRPPFTMDHITSYHCWKRISMKGSNG